jgi:hypothetical protein
VRSGLETVKPSISVLSGRGTIEECRTSIMMLKEIKIGFCDVTPPEGVGRIRLTRI